MRVGTSPRGLNFVVVAEKLDIIRPVLIDSNATMIRTIVTDSLQLSTYARPANGDEDASNFLDE